MKKAVTDCVEAQQPTDSLIRGAIATDPATPECNAVNVVTANNLPFGANALEQSNPDGNGNYQTVEYFCNGFGGDLVMTLTLTFDANSNVVTYLETITP